MLCAEDNGAAISLYEELGYERLKVRMANVVMRKSLGGAEAAGTPTTTEGATTRAASEQKGGGAAAASASASPPSPPPPKSPFASLVGGLVSALESVLESGFPGVNALIAEAERELKADERAVALLGDDLSIDDVDVDPTKSMNVAAGVQIEAAVAGSRGSGSVVIGASRNDDLDDPDGPELRLEVLRLVAGEEDFYLVEP